ncbi:MAG: hypothetical protein R3A79_13405 [Nannocystaceae bacterium]
MLVAPLLLLTACAGDDGDETMGSSASTSSTTATTSGTSDSTGDSTSDTSGGDSDSDATSASTGDTTGDSDPTTTGDSDSTTAGESTSTTDDPTTTTDSTTTGIMPDPDQIPPTDSNDALLTWLGEGSYTEWNAESGIHQSTGPHGGQVRTFLNDALYESYVQGLTSHPEGAVAVKELWGNGDNIIGWAVEIKVQADSDGGDGWYWYEKINQSEYGGALGLGLCTGCHSGGGVDYVLTPWPLQ